MTFGKRRFLFTFVLGLILCYIPMAQQQSFSEYLKDRCLAASRALNTAIAEAILREEPVSEAEDEGMPDSQQEYFSASEPEAQGDDIFGPFSDAEAENGSDYDYRSTQEVDDSEVEEEAEEDDVDEQLQDYFDREELNGMEIHVEALVGLGEQTDRVPLPFQHKEEELAKWERASCDGGVWANAGEGATKVSDPSIYWPYRAMGSELYGLGSYTPLFAMPAIAFAGGYHEKQYELWERILGDGNDNFIWEFVCEPKDSACDPFCSWLGSHREIPTTPLALRLIFVDLLFRILFAKGRQFLVEARRHLSFTPDFYPGFPHRRCPLSWTNSQYGCMCREPRINAQFSKQHSSCCYTAQANAELEVLECIRIIQRLFLPLTGSGDDLIFNANRMDKGVAHGLVWYCTRKWRDILTHYSGGALFERESYSVRRMVHAYMVVEYFNRPCETAMFPWDQMVVLEYLPFHHLTNIVMPKAAEAFRVIVRNYNIREFGLGREMGPDHVELIERGVHVDMGLAVCRSVADHWELRDQFVCTRCKQIAENGGVFMMNKLMQTHVSGGRAFATGLKLGLVQEDFCLASNYELHTKEHALGPSCCEMHMHRLLDEVQWDSERGQRICFGCLLNENNYLFVARAGLDQRAVDVFDTAHYGAYWIDVEWVLNQFVSSGRSTKK